MIIFQNSQLVLPNKEHRVDFFLMLHCGWFTLTVNNYYYMVSHQEILRETFNVPEAAGLTVRRSRPHKSGQLMAMVHTWPEIWD